MEDLFQKRPTNRNYESVKMHSFHPVESLTNASQVSFVMPRFLGPNMYVPSGMLLKLEVQLERVPTATNPSKTIAPGKVIGPINNTLHSLFKSCRIWLGETLITKNGENYPYKSYLIDLLSYDTDGKYSWLEGQLYIVDVFGPTLDSQTTDNAGFQARMNFFKNEDESAFLESPVSIMGRLHTDLASTGPGIIPGLGMKVELTFASSDFVLQKAKNDQDSYKIVIKNATLFCPVAQLSDDMFRRIERKLQKEDASFYIQTCEVTNKNIPANSSLFCDNLFPGSNLPNKLILCVVPTTNYLGTQTTNPLYFGRKFFQARVAQVAADADHPPSGSGSRAGGIRIPGFGSTSSLASCEEAGAVRGCDDDCFIEKASLTLNGESLDGLDGGFANCREDITNFIRLHYFMGYMHSRTGNALTYEEFRNGFFMLFFDLSTSSQSSVDFEVPAVRQGHLHLQLNFSKAVPQELTLIMYAEYSTLLKIDKNRQVKMSY